MENEAKNISQENAQEKDAYQDGIMACAEGGNRQHVSKIYDNPQHHVVRGFNAGFDAQLIAKSRGESLY